MSLPKKSLLGKQIEVFLEWGDRTGTTPPNYREYLEIFRQSTEREDVLDITDKDVDFFAISVQDRSNSSLPSVYAKRAVEALRRFYMARSKNGKTHLRTGRPPKMDKVELVVKYRQKGRDGKPILSYRQIAKVLGKDVGQIFKWAIIGEREKIGKR